MDNLYLLKGTFEKEEGIPVQFSVQGNSSTPVNSMNSARAYLWKLSVSSKIKLLVIYFTSSPAGL